MKTKSFIYILATLAISSSMALLFGCQRQTDSEKISEKINKEKFETRSEEKDAQFLVDVAVLNMEEIQLGKLAQTKGTKKEVQDIGKMMEDEHSRFFTDLKDLAEKKGVTIPTDVTPKIQEMYNDLSKKSASEFNEEYCSRMVTTHKDAIDKVEKAATESTDNDIKAWAMETLPELKKHLDHAMTCQSTVKMEGSMVK